MKRWLYITLIVLFVLVFVVSAGMLTRYYLQSRQQQSQFEALAQMVAKKQPAPAADATTQVQITNSCVWVTDPDTGEKVQVLEEYADIYLRNNHTVGWMCIDGTKINYPVMQTPQEANYYLKRNFQREYSAHGCLYVQENCSVATPSDNLIIYGHNMRDGSMFAALLDYAKESFYLEHPTIRFDTLTRHQTYEILSVFYTSASEGLGFAYHEFTDAANAFQFDDFVSTCKALSIYNTGVEADFGDKLITLSTCEYSQTNGRLVIVAKRVKN